MPVKRPGTRWRLMWKRNITAIAFIRKSTPCFSPLFANTHARAVQPINSTVRCVLGGQEGKERRRYR
jgi:hypothetical protein